MSKFIKTAKPLSEMISSAKKFFGKAPGEIPPMISKEVSTKREKDIIDSVFFANDAKVPKASLRADSQKAFDAAMMDPKTKLKL